VSYSTFCERISTRHRSEKEAIKTPKQLGNCQKTVKKTTKKTKRDCDCTKQCTPDTKEETTKQEVPTEVSEAVEKFARNTNVYPHKTVIIADFEGNTEDQVKDNISKGRVNSAVERVKSKAYIYTAIIGLLCFLLGIVACRLLSYFLAL